jgi:hypothetical protein
MAGTVMVIGENGTLVPCSRRYDTRVIGVVSGGGSLKPAVTLRYNSFLSPSVVVALVGTVYCLADASYGTISPGDVLVASDTVGHAMRATEPDHPGAMIGKALAPLLEGRGLIPIIVALR